VIYGGFPLAATAPSPKADTDDRELTERENLLAWELLMLLENGFSLDQSKVLIKQPHFSWHDARDLLDKGVPHWYVVHELGD
jgi:hypothetical protein